MALDIMEFYTPKRCKECGEIVTDRNVTGYCKRCYDRTYQRKVAAQRRQDGVCRGCGSPIDDPRFVRCAKCRKYNNDYKNGRLNNAEKAK